MICFRTHRQRTNPNRTRWIWSPYLIAKNLCYCVEDTTSKWRNQVLM